MVNILGSVIAGVVSMAFGFFWYSDSVFGKKWRKEMGITDQMTEEYKAQGYPGMKKQISLGLLAEIVTALVLSYIFYSLNVFDIWAGVKITFWLWLGFCATLQLGQVLWGKFPTPWNLFYINASHRLISLLVMAIIIFLI
jgi:hypothetical protein